MSRKKPQSKAESAKDALEALGKETQPIQNDGGETEPSKPAANIETGGEPTPVSQPRTNDSQAADQMGSEQTAPPPPTEQPEQPGPEQHALVLVSNAFDRASVPISKERLHELEDRFRTKMKAAHEVAAEAIEVILTIRDERQYEAEGYKTFDAYMAKEWGYSRSWVELMEKRLPMIRLMEEKLGVSPDDAPKRLTLYDASILRPLQDDPDVLIAAIKEAEERYKTKGKKSPKILKEVVEKWDGFTRLDKELQSKRADTPPEERPQRLTPEEFSLLAQLRRNKSNPRRLGLVEQAKQKAQAESIPLVLALDKVCEEANAVPPDEEILKEARGEGLKELVAPLIARVRLWKAVDKLKKDEAQLEAERAKAELDKLQKEMAKTPEEKEQERLGQEEERRKQEEQEAEQEKERQEAHERWKRQQEIWGWHEDDLSLSSDGDPRKWCEQDNHEGFDSDSLVRVAADCLADAVKRLPELREADKPIAIQAADKAIKWAKEFLAQLAAQKPQATTSSDPYFPDDDGQA